MRDFFAMSGYGFYVWTSYAVFFIVLAIEALAPVVRRPRLLADLRGRIRRRRAREGDSAP